MNKNFIKKNIIIALIVTVLFLTSCNASRELDTLGIVITSGIDFEDGEIILTNEVINPVSGTGMSDTLTQDKSIFVQGVGRTIEEALADTTLHFNRVLFYPHNHLLIFGEEFAKRGIGDYLDILSRDQEQRESAYMLIAKGAKAYDIMGINGGVTNSPGIYLFQMLEGDVYNAQTRTINLDEFFKYFYRKNEDIVLGVAEEIERPAIGKPKTEKIRAISIAGGAAFKEDRLVCYFSNEEMMGFNFIVDEITTASIVFESPNYLVDSNELIAKTGKYSVVNVFKSKTKGDVKVIDGEPHLFINIKFRGILKETTQGLDISKPGVLDAMEEACADKVKGYIEMSIKRAQEFKTDVFGIGTLIHQKQPKLWKEIEKDWISIFSELDYTINVEADINGTGFTNTPPNLRKGK